MSRDLKVMIGVLATAILFMIGLSSLEIVEDYPVSLLILTRDGCTYAQSLGLKTEQNKGLCVALARYRPYAFSDGGVVYLQDARQIVVTNNMLLAYHKSEVELPLSSEQQSALRWFWIWVTVAVLFGIATMIYGLGPWGRKKAQSK